MGGESVRYKNANASPLSNREKSPKPKDVKSFIKSQLRIPLNSDREGIFRKVERQMSKTLRIRRRM